MKRAALCRAKFAENRCHALADVLHFHRIINTEALGAEFIGKLFYYERWIVAFANILFEKSILTPDQLARKMGEVSTRFHSIGDIRTMEVANFPCQPP
jgi:Nitrile hydratase beta subunit, N-terminal